MRIPLAKTKTKWIGSVKDRYKTVNMKPSTETAPSKILLTVWVTALVLGYAGWDRLQLELEKQEWVQENVRIVNTLATVEQLLHQGLTREIREEGTAFLRSGYNLPRLFREPAFVITQEFEGGDLIPDSTRIHRILIVGASSIQYYLGAELERRLENYEGIDVLRFGKLSTGLVRDDVLDWPEKLTELMTEFQPDLVIAQFGGNDCQGLTLPDGRTASFNTEEWRAEYRNRLNEILHLTQEQGATPIMIGMPNMRETRFARRIHALNELTEEQTDSAGAIFYPLWELTSDSAGNYLPTVEFHGDVELMRLPDGIHFSRHGAQYVADQFCLDLEQQYTLSSESDSLADYYRFQHFSEARNDTVHYYAYVPDRGENERLPAVILLHGAYGAPEDWAFHAHRDLQYLSFLHRLILVLPDGNEHGWYLDSPYDSTSQIETYLISEFIPEVIGRLPVNSDFSMMGLSMGGHGALSVGLKHPDLFVSLSSMSGVVNLIEAADRPALIRLLGPYGENERAWRFNSAYQIIENYPTSEPVPHLMVTCGTSDSRLEMNRELHALLQELNIDHEYRESDGGHTWTYWVEQLPEHLEWHATYLHSLDNVEYFSEETDLIEQRVN